LALQHVGLGILLCPIHMLGKVGDTTMHVVIFQSQD